MPGRRWSYLAFLHFFLFFFSPCLNNWPAKRLISQRTFLGTSQWLEDEENALIYASAHLRNPDYIFPAAPGCLWRQRQ
jgi:hypothetical protein